MAWYGFFLFLNIKHGNNIDDTKNILKVYYLDLIIGILEMYTYGQHVRNKECIICNVFFKF